MASTATESQFSATVRPGRSRRASRLKRLGIGLGAFLVVATAFIGFLHTKAGHPLLMQLAGVAGCPMGRADAAQVDAVRRAAVAKDRGTDPAPARPALGFLLDTTSLADVRAWEKKVGVECTAERDGTLVKCVDVPSVALGRPPSDGSLAELSFGFSPQGPLVAVTTLYSHRDADDASRIAARSETELAKDLGSPHKAAGSFVLVGSTATLEYRFRDYAVDVTSSRVPGSGYAVREHYMSTF